MYRKCAFQTRSDMLKNRKYTLTVFLLSTLKPEDAHTVGENVLL